MAERTSDWELVNAAAPAVYRHRGRGNLWVIDGELTYVPGATLADVIALVKSIDEIGKPVVVEPVKPPPFVEFPKWVVVHEFLDFAPERPAFC